MSRAIFYPYPTAQGAIALSWAAAGPDEPDSRANTILAEGLGENQAVSLELDAELDPSTYDWVLPEGERADPPTELRIAVRSIPSRQRTSVRLEPTEDRNRFTGRLELPKRDYYGDVRLEPSLVRVGPGTEAGYAQHIGAQLAFGDPIVVQVDEPPVPPGDYLEIEFEDFLSSGNSNRRKHPELLYMLDTDRETPKLWLNSRVEDFQQVMHHDAPRGRLRRVRDATFDTIVSQVWTSLASIAFSALAIKVAERRSEEDSDEDPMDALPEWEQRVIALWAPGLYPSGTKEEALERVKAAARHPETFAELHELLAIAVQGWAKSPDAFKGLMRWAHEEGV
jgi:hypothetical protein